MVQKTKPRTVAWRTEKGGNPTPIGRSLHCWKCKSKVAKWMASFSVGTLQTCDGCLQLARTAEMKWEVGSPARKKAQNRERQMKFEKRKAWVQGGVAATGQGTICAVTLKAFSMREAPVKTIRNQAHYVSSLAPIIDCTNSDKHGELAEKVLA